MLCRAGAWGRSQIWTWPLGPKEGPEIVPKSIPWVSLCQVRLPTLPPAKQGTILTCAQQHQPQLLQLCCIPSSPRHWRGAEEEQRKFQFSKSFHLMIIYELDQKLITVALKKGFLAAKQLAQLSSENIKYAFAQVTVASSINPWFPAFSHNCTFYTQAC